nr:unnamed protein product [Callosobruchus chinensis]
MREEDINGNKNRLRMLPHKSDELLSKIESSIQKQDTREMLIDMSMLNKQTYVQTC